MRDERPPRDRLRLAAAVAEQLDADLMDAAEGYAAKRCAMLEKAGGWAEPAELVQDAIEATLSGARAWDPERYSLYHHVCGVIGSRTTSMLKHARKFRHERLGARGEHGDQTDPIETAASLQQEQADPEARFLDAERVHQTVGRLRGLAEAKNDHQVLGILDAYAEGITERAEVAAHLGIGVRKYDHARMRMLRLAGKLEDEGLTDA